jgi:GNAT superfamily N-acetyltransferase
LAELNRDVQQIHVDALPNIYKQVDDLTPVIEDFNQRILSQPNWFTYIVEVDGEAVGYACAEVRRRPEHAYHHAHEYVYLDQISVRPEYRGSGCGRLLMDAVFDLARSTGVSRVALDTMAFNTGAIAFYERLGFKMYKHTMDLQLEDERQL